MLLSTVGYIIRGGSREGRERGSRDKLIERRQNKRKKSQGGQDQAADERSKKEEA